MPGYIVSLVVSGVLYVTMVHFMVKYLKKQPNPQQGQNPQDGDDGGLLVSIPFDLDLPPGVTLPNDGPRGGVGIDISELEEELVY